MFPNVEATNTGSRATASTIHTINLPDDIQAGELLLILFSYGATGNSVFFPEGWEQFIADEQTSGSNEGFAAACRLADGSEGSTVTVNTASSARSSHVTLRISLAEDPATQPPEALSAKGTNGSPNPPALTPTGGAKDYLWLAIGSSSHGGSYTAAPTDYSNLVQSAGGATGEGGSALTGVAERKLNAASEDAGAFAHDQSAIAEWIGVMVAIHPASGGGTPSTAVPVFVHHLKQQGVS